MAAGSSSILVLILPSMFAQADLLGSGGYGVWVWSFSQALVCLTLNKLGFFGIMTRHVEAQSIELVIVPIVGICPQCYE